MKHILLQRPFIPPSLIHEPYSGSFKPHFYFISVVDAYSKVCHDEPDVAKVGPVCFLQSTVTIFIVYVLTVTFHSRRDLFWLLKCYFLFTAFHSYSGNSNDPAKSDFPAH